MSVIYSITMQVFSITLDFIFSAICVLKRKLYIKTWE